MFTLGDLAERLNARLVGDANVAIRGIGSLAQASAEQISHFSSVRYLSELKQSQAGAVILRDPDIEHWTGPALVVSNPYLTYARTTSLFAKPSRAGDGVHSTAVVAASAEIAAGASLGPGVVVGERARIGEGAQLFANAYVGDDCLVGDHSRLMPNSVLYADVHLGARCVVHSAAVLGADGFGYTPDEQGQLVEIAQLGGVRVGDDVSIGAATTVDRGALDHTEISSGVKIDNQVQIGHNCHIGAHSLICGCVGIVGSTRIGAHCVLAGGVGVGGDGPIEICSGVIVSGMTHISQSITEPGVYSGGILQSTSRQWKRNALRFLRLDDLARRVSRLEKAQDND